MTAALLLLAAGISRDIAHPVGAASPTFQVTREGNTSTYHATSSTSTESFSGSLKFVVEEATYWLDADGGGSLVFAAGDFNLGSDWLEIEAVSDIVYAGQGIDVTTIRNSTSESRDTEVFDFGGGVDRITIRDMTVSAGGSQRNTSDAIDFDGGDDSVVERVKIVASRGRGIVFDGKDDVPTAGGTADGNIVRDCIITGVPQDGIQLLASNGNRIENCQIFDTGGHGINVNKSSTSADQPDKPSNDNLVLGNTITNAGQHGIRIRSGSRNVLSGNTVLDSSDDVSSRDGINLVSDDSIVCDDNLIELNTASDNQSPKTQRYGLNISSSECHRTLVDNNDFAGNRIAEINDNGTDTNYLPDDNESPTSPTRLEATAVSYTRVDLTWTAATDNIGVAGYAIYRDGVAIDIVDGATLAYSDTTVAASTTYSYAVDAFDGVGNRSARSAPAAANTPDPPPNCQADVEGVGCDPTDDGPLCDGKVATIVGDADGDGLIVGTAGDDVITGTSGPDVIRGLGGDDKICALDGNDLISGGPGNDWIHGGPGRDRAVFGGELPVVVNLLAGTATGQGTDELIAIGLARPRLFAPGTNWDYSHTNYVILGRALERATGRPMAALLRERVLDPLGLKNTVSSSTASIPE
ncbi:MAG: serine hydrolase, partial [Dehalococcoidia bacterium]|nr:serine hydrolase [Dehalococcoidia bacterium]